jgi:hypothetical protein
MDDLDRIRENYFRSKSSDDYRTDEWILDLFAGFQDPCPFQADFNGLDPSFSWGPRCFVNPPYSKPGPWVDRAILENKKGKLIVLLHEAGAHFLAPIGRLKHQTGRSANFPSILVVLS